MSKLIEQKDDFIKGRMTPAEQADFNDKLAADPILAEGVNQQAQVVGVLNAVGMDGIRADIKSVSNEYHAKSARKIKDDDEKKLKSDQKPIKNKSTVKQTAIIKAILTIDSRTSELLKVSYSFNQLMNQIGEPSSIVYGGRITLTLASSGKNDLFAWAVLSDAQKDGQIELIDANGKVAKTIEFFEAWCINYNEKFTAFKDTKSGLLKEEAREVLTLYANKIRIRGESFTGYK